MIRVLFVCLGNICRSPMAEAIFAHLVREAGLQNAIEADSCGTGGWHTGAPAHHGTREILRRNAIDYDGCARRIVRADLDDFDTIVAMDETNRRDIALMHGALPAGREVKLLLEYAPQQALREVPDPYFDGKFDDTYGLIRVGCEGLLDAICREHHLSRDTVR